MASWSYLSPNEKAEEQAGIEFNRRPLMLTQHLTRTHKIKCGACEKFATLTCVAGPVPGKGCLPTVSVTCSRCGATVTK